MHTFKDIGRQIRDIKDPRVSDYLALLKQTPNYNDEDTPTVKIYEARGGKSARSGSLTLREHDLLHFLLGINLVAYNEKQKKDGERFLSGFTYGACPEFGSNDLQWFISTVKQKFPKNYQFGERGGHFLREGFSLGRQWQSVTQMNLQAFLAEAIADDKLLRNITSDFYNGNNFLQHRVSHFIMSHLDEIRGGVRESFLPTRAVRGRSALFMAML